MSLNAPNASPVTPFQRNANEAPFVIGRDVEDEAVDSVEIQNVDAFALVEPDGRVVFRLQRRHDDVNVVVAQAQYGFVRIDQVVRREARANFVELSTRKSLSVLEEIVERVQGAELQRLPLVIDATPVVIHRPRNGFERKTFRGNLVNWFRFLLEVHILQRVLKLHGQRIALNRSPDWIKIKYNLRPIRIILLFVHYK